VNVLPRKACQIQDRTTNATIPTPTRVRTFKVRRRGPMVMATETRSRENGPMDADTEVVRKDRAALSGRKDSESFVNNPPRKRPKISVQIKR
jgi:hypothetical protein